MNNPPPTDPNSDPRTIPHVPAPDGDATVPPVATPPPTAVSSLPTLWALGQPPELPAQFGRYRLDRLLGQGGMGAVYLAFDSQMDRPVALKIPAFSGSEAAAARERFLREARAAGTMSHPNLCQVYDVGAVDGVQYLTMAYIEGEPLSARLRAGGPLPPDKAANLVRQLALALHEAHEHGIVHRDLKPANVMLNRKGQPVVMDFGLARRAAGPDEVRLTQSGAVLGTPAYMPPEQVNADARAIGPRTDVYSLGVILYECLTGRVPFDGPFGTLMARILLDAPPPPSKYRPDLDPRLEAICLKALEKKPDDRYQTMAEFAADLDTYLAGATPTALALAPPVVVEEFRPAAVKRPRPEKKSRGFLKTLLGCGCFAVVVPSLAIALAVGVIYKLAPGTIDLIQREIAKSQRWDDVAKSWHPPPADAGTETWFPSPIGGFVRVSQDDKAAVPEFKIDRPGRHAVYRQGDDEIEVFVYRASALEKEAVVRRALEFIAPPKKGVSAKPNQSHQIVGGPEGTFLWYEFGAGVTTDERGIFWYAHEWLFLARSRTAYAVDDFLKDYLNAVNTPVPSAGPAPTGPAATGDGKKQKRNDTKP